ncbi:MAG: chorismate-binding protein, partial [Prevotella sp.]|nr:chorismate-binding protein [Prevotella sp.]
METFNYTTKTRAMLADMHTPVSVYMRLRDMYPQSVLMESSDYHDRNNSRSFICIHPMAQVAINHGKAIITLPDGIREERDIDDDYHVHDAIRSLTESISIEGEKAECCGLYGYTSFNAVRYFENIKVKDETMEKNDAPDMLYILYRNIIVLDHYTDTMTIVTLGDESEIEEMMHHINRASVRPYGFHPVGETTSTITDEEHRENIRRGIRHCMRGDVFQIVLSRRFVQQYEGDDFQLYRSLRSINPSPYLFYFDFGGFRIFGSSP